MPLEPPPNDELYCSLAEAATALQEHTAEQGYAVSVTRSKQDKNGETYKRVFACSHGGVPTEHTNPRRIRTSTRRIGCEFKCYILNSKKDGGWIIRVTESEHNHEHSDPSAYPQHRLAQLTDARMRTIRRAIEVGSLPRQILTQLHAEDPSIDLGSRDIYNAIAAIRRQTLGQRTPIQALIAYLRDGDWCMSFTLNAQRQVTHLFYINKHCEDLLKANPQVLMMDCTYKTNRYRLPLMIISGVTPLNTTFYVGFCFLIAEKEVDFTWALERLRDILEGFNVPDPRVIVTDDEGALHLGLATVFPHSARILCLWHINKNVLSHVKKIPSLRKKEDFEKAMSYWHAAIYAKNLTEHLEKWAEMQEAYREHEDLLTYLQNTWIDRSDEFVRCYTDRLRHYGNTSNSRAEGANWGIKYYLINSRSDLNEVINGIAMKLKRQFIDYNNNLALAKTRRSLQCMSDLYSEVIAFITPFALNKIHEQRVILYNPAEQQKPCGHRFTSSMGLPCSHLIATRLAAGECIHLSDVDPHWRYNTSGYSRETGFITVEDESIDPDLNVRNPPVVRTRGRPAGALNRLQMQHDRSIHRDPSEWERIDAELIAAQIDEAEREAQATPPPPYTERDVTIQEAPPTHPPESMMTEEPTASAITPQEEDSVLGTALEAANQWIEELARGRAEITVMGGFDEVLEHATPPPEAVIAAEHPQEAGNTTEHPPEAVIAAEHPQEAGNTTEHPPEAVIAAEHPQEAGNTTEHPPEAVIAAEHPQEVGNTADEVPEGPTRRGTRTRQPTRRATEAPAATRPRKRARRV